MHVLAIVWWARRKAGVILDHNRPMYRADADGRLAGNKPGTTDFRAPAVRQIATGETYLNPLHSLRRTQHRFGLSRILIPHRIDNLEEQRGSSIRTYESGVAGAVEIAHPDDEHVGSEDAGGPSIAECP